MLLRSANIKLMSDAKRESHANHTDRELPEHRSFCRVMKGINRFFSRVYHRIDVLSPCRVPDRGPAILICNHTSGVDPALVQSPCPRVITWMMAKEYYDIPRLKPLFDKLGVIPVTRSGRDMAATRAAMRALHDGQILGVFPEGRIEKTDELLPFQTGVALMAVKTGVPVFPAYLDGTQRGREMLKAMFTPQRATIAFGPEVVFNRDCDDRECLEAATAAMRDAVESLRQKARKSRPIRGF